MNKGIWAVSFIATTLLVGTIAASLPIQDADAARASKPKEIVVVGSKVKDVVRTVKLDSCDFVLYSSDRTIVGRNNDVSANAGGVIHLPDIDDEVLTADVDCIFEDGTPESVIGVELKERGTTVIHVGDTSRPGGR
ncbi:MAG: hypothetical protein ACE5RT_03035 [Nitrosopumilaceae archaeon]